MLVLTRKQSEVINIGDDIVVRVIRTSRGSVKIGIDAPDNVRILRAELCGKPPNSKQQPPPESDGADPGALSDNGVEPLSHPLVV